MAVIRLSSRSIGWLAAILLSSFCAFSLRSALPIVSILVLWLGWSRLPSYGRIPVIQLAFSFQWMQVMIGFFYIPISGRLPYMQRFDAFVGNVDFTTYAYYSLAGLTVLIFAIAGGWRLAGGGRATEMGLSLPAQRLWVTYVVAAVVTLVLARVAFQYPALTQGLLALSYVRVAIAYVLLRRHATRREWRLFALVAAMEFARGLSGYLADFKEPLVFVVVAILENVEFRGTRNLLRLSGALVVLLISGIVWTGIKGQYREQLTYNDKLNQSSVARIKKVVQLAYAWMEHPVSHFAEDLDRMVLRLWVVEYPSLALRRVPAQVPFEDGALVSRAIKHTVMPRMFFPDKPGMVNDSEFVRTYAGVWVSGEETGTSFAFGYMAESYVDFGFPGLLIPVAAWGLLVGLVVAGLTRAIRTRDLKAAMYVVMIWLLLGSFERSWTMNFGLLGNLSIFLGGFFIGLDRYVRANRTKAVGPPAFPLAAK